MTGNFHYRLKYQKGERMKFIGHLDFLRFFQRIIRKSGIPIGYSNGFNPHQMVSFAAPLPLGMTSSGDYCDIETTAYLEPSALLEAINPEFPEDVKLLRATPFETGEQRAMASVAAGKYLIQKTTHTPLDFTAEDLNAFLSQPNVMVWKKSKKGLKEMDLLPGVYSCVIQKDSLETILQTGSERNIKPEQFLEALYQFLNLPFSRYTFSFERIDLYKPAGELWQPLDAHLLWNGGPQ